MEITAEEKIAHLLARAKQFQAASRSPKTWQGYNRDFGYFTSWCMAHERPFLPADVETVIAYLVSMVERGLSAATINRASAAICKAHDLAEHPSPTRMAEVKELLAGIKRALGTEPKRKTPLSVIHLSKILQALPNTLRGHRDRAIILIGFAGALRRSEIVRLTMDDVFWNESGMVLRIVGAKGDRESATQRVGIPKARRRKLCAVRALLGWLKMSGISTGPLFRPIKGTRTIKSRALTDQAVAQTIKRAIRGIGMNPETFSGHSLRRGIITAAAHKGVPLVRLRTHSRHKTIQAMMPYIEDLEAFVDNPVETVLGSPAKTPK